MSFSFDEESEHLIREHVELRNLPMFVQRSMPLSLLRNDGFEFALRLYIDEAFMAFSIQIKTSPLALELEKKELRAPKDWWEALRARWFPTWWLNRYPVKYETQSIEVHALYPKIRVPNPGGYVVRLVTHA